MLSRLASYLLRGSASGAEDGDAPLQDDAEKATKEITSIPVEARLRQVEVEGDEWILIDRNGKSNFQIFIDNFSRAIKEIINLFSFEINSLYLFVQRQRFKFIIPWRFLA
jgi:hypothetical protein